MNSKAKQLGTKIGQLKARLADELACEKEKLRKVKRREAFIIGEWFQKHEPWEVAEILKKIAAKKS